MKFVAITVALLAIEGGVLFAAGYGGTLIASGVSPLPMKTWVGTFDSSWMNPGNWSPIGVPEKLDSRLHLGQL